MGLARPLGDTREPAQCRLMRYSAHLHASNVCIVRGIRFSGTSTSAATCVEQIAGPARINPDGSRSEVQAMSRC